MLGLMSSQARLGCGVLTEKSPIISVASSIESPQCTENELERDKCGVLQLQLQHLGHVAAKVPAAGEVRAGGCPRAGPGRGSHPAYLEPFSKSTVI